MLGTLRRHPFLRTEVDVAKLRRRPSDNPAGIEGVKGNGLHANVFHADVFDVNIFDDVSAAAGALEANASIGPFKGGVVDIDVANSPGGLAAKHNAAAARVNVAGDIIAYHNVFAGDINV